MKHKVFILTVFLLSLLALAACGNLNAEEVEETRAEETDISLEEQIAAASQPVEEPEIPMEEWENVELYQEIDKETVEKTVITLGTLQQYDELEWLVTQFNEASEFYVAQLTYYDDLTTLATYIVAGDGPDVLYLSGVPYAHYIESGAFLALSDILDTAEGYEPKLRELTKAQYDDQILIGSCRFNCIAAPEYVLQGKTSWTYAEFKEAAGQTNTFQKFVKERCLGLYCLQNLGEYIDATENTCSFDSEEFCGVLEFANQFAADESQIVDGAADIQLTKSVSFISDLDTAWYEEFFWDSSPSTYLGFPSDSGAGIMVDPDLQLAVLASTKQEAGAKALVSYALSESFQSFVASQDRFPVIYSALKNQLTAVFTTDDYEDAPIADEMLAKLEDIWERTTGISYMDAAIYNIIMEEAAYYFNGAKTVEEVTSLIQNRAQLYLSEQA